ncbi:MAG: hypothetical protein D6830_04965, partial [Ignavibacteria bacterium]
MKLSIRNKLILGFGTLIFSFLAFGFFVYSLLNEYNEDITKFSHTKDDVFEAYSIQNDITNVWQYFTDASLTLDHKVIVNEIDPLFNSLKSKLKALTQKTSSDELKKILDESDEFYSTGKKMFSAYSRSKTEGDLVMAEFDRVSENYISNINEYVNSQKLRLHESYSELIKMGNSGQSNVEIFLFIAFIFSVVLSYFISRNLTVPVKALENAM